MRSEPRYNAQLNAYCRPSACPALAQAPASVILGVTNPFFVKALEHWPHPLRVGQDVRAHTAANRNNKSSLEFVPVGGARASRQARPLNADPSERVRRRWHVVPLVSRA